MNVEMAQAKQPIRKIMLVLPDLKAGGAQRMFINMANFFAQEGYVTHLVLLTNAQSDFKDLSSDVNVEQFPSSRAARSLLPFSQVIRTTKPDVIISALTYVNLISIFARILSGHKSARLIVTERAYHSINAKLATKHYTLEKILIRLLYQRSDKVVGISKGVTEDIAKIAHLPLEKTATIYNPVVTDALIHKLNAPIESALPTGKIILSCGRLTSIKDFPTLLKAFKLLIQTHDDAHLVLLGDGPLKQKLIDLAIHLGIKDRVHFLGFIENPMPYFKCADVFVLTSKSEGFGNVIVEALYAGTPVVSTDCPTGPKEILSDLRDCLAPVGDAQTLSRLIDLKLRQSKDSQSYQACANNFHVKTICNHYIKLAIGIDHEH